MSSIRFPELVDHTAKPTLQSVEDKNSLVSMQGLGFMREKIGGRVRRTLLAGMSLAALSLSEGCRADLLPPPELTFNRGFVDTDTSDVENVDGTFIIDSEDAVDGGVDSSMDGSTDDATLEVGEEVVGVDGEDAIDGGIDDAMDGSTDDATLEVDGEDAMDGSTDDATLEVDEEVVGVDGEDAIDGGIDDAMDGSTDDATLEVGEDVVEIDGQDAIDGGIDDAVDGSTDDATLDVVGDVSDLNGDAVDGGIDDAVDGSTDDAISEVVNDVTDSTDTSEPLKTCGGKPVGTVQIIPTQGPNGEVGICLNGKEVCSSIGTWEIQTSPVDPAPAGEICSDSLDNDCNGTTDEVPCSCDGNVDGLVDMDKFDPLFKDFILGALGKKPNDTISVIEANNVINLMVKAKGLNSIAGAECFPNAEIANFGLNNIVDISPLSYLLKLREVYLGKNLIADLSPLKDLIALEIAVLLENPFKDISPLILNNGLGQGDMVDLTGNASVPATQIKALKDKGVTVIQ